MNLRNKTSKILVLMLTLFVTNTIVYAQQQSLDKDRLNRDLSITEDILARIFSDNYNQNMPFGHRLVDASYLSGYGIIYHISGSPFSMMRQIRMSTSGNGRSRSNVNNQGSTNTIIVGGHGRGFRYWYDNAKNALTRQQVIDRATEFLTNYGNTIGQLRPTDRVTIIYKENSNDFLPNSMMQIINKDSSTSKSINLGISSKKADITALNQNKINKKEFSNRLSVSDIEGDEQHKDLDIFAEILNQALKNTNKYEYSSRGNVNYTYLNNFGVIYFVNAEYSLQYLSALTDYSKLIVQSNQNSGSKTNTASNDDKEIKKAYDRFLDTMLDYITNYGRTLHTLQKGQTLVISANLNDGIGGEVRRVTFTIKSDVLQKLNDGVITQKQARGQIDIQSF